MRHVSRWLATLLVLAAAGCGKTTEPHDPSGTFLSDTDELYGRLEELQREVGACENPISLAKANENVKKWLDKDCVRPGHEWQCPESYRALEILGSLKPTTPCESGLRFSGPALYAVKLDHVLSKNVPRPRLGTLVTGDINAFAMRFGSPRDYLVILNPDLAHVHQEIVRYVLNLLDIKGTPGVNMTITLSAKEVRKKIAADPEQAAFFAQLIASTVRGERLPMAPDFMRVTPDRFETLYESLPHGKIVVSIAEQAEGFIVAHEFAHAALDHGAHSSSVLQVSAVPRPLEVAIRSAERELEADETGLTLWLKVMSIDADIDQSLQALLIFSPDTLLTSARLLELEREISGLPPVPGYPSADTRRRQLRSVFSRTGLLSPDSTQDFGALFHAAAMIAFTRVNSARIDELHDKGIDIALERFD